MKRFLLIIIALLICAFLLFPALNTGHPVPKQSTAWAEMVNIQTACLMYQKEYKRLPLGTEQEIARTLAGNNPKGKVFLVPDHITSNEDGALLDPWGTPYRIQIVPEEPPSIQSAGKDRKWGTKDDLSTHRE